MSVSSEVALVATLIAIVGEQQGVGLTAEKAKGRTRHRCVAVTSDLSPGVNTGGVGSYIYDESTAEPQP